MCIRWETGPIVFPSLCFFCQYISRLHGQSPGRRSYRRLPPPALLASLYTLLIVLGGTIQTDWQHAVPKMRHSGPRLSIMIRSGHRR